VAIGLEVSRCVQGNDVERREPVPARVSVRGPPSQAVYDAKLDGLAATINAQAPDAVSLQEIGDPKALRDLVGRLSGGAWHQCVSQHPDRRHIRVAWLTRRAITASEEILQSGPARTGAD
jgi:hypothetical protein